MNLSFALFAAAHCFKEKNGDYVLPPQYVSAFTGKYNLNIVDELGSTEHSVWEILIHPDWKSRDERYDADISVVVLRDAVEFTTKFMPVCLPQPSDVVTTGFVVGWGKSNVSEESSEKLVPTPNQLEVPAVNKSHCLASVPGIEFYASDRTFCGGYLNQSKSTCIGDSGGGFYLRSSSSHRFNLAGIISSSMADFYKGCDNEVYSLFTNVAKFVEWIGEKMEKTKQIVWKAVEFECKEIHWIQ